MAFPDPSTAPDSAPTAPSGPQTDWSAETVGGKAGSEHNSPGMILSQTPPSSDAGGVDLSWDNC